MKESADNKARKLTTKDESELEAAEMPVNEEGSKAENQEVEAELVDNPETDKAVEDVTLNESDELLQDQDKASEVVAPIGRRGFLRSVGNGLASWWRNKPARRLTLFVSFVIVIGLLVYPTTRYWILNVCGARASASVVLTDQKTQLPLQGVKVEIGTLQAKTDSTGKATISGLKLGNQYLEIDQTGFASIEKPITIGWGSNPLSPIELEPTGIRFTIILWDYLSDKPIVGAIATSGQATATSDQIGKIELTLANKDDALQPVAITKDGYRSESIILLSDPTQVTQVKLVTGKPAVFISKQSGRYDVYRSDIDGKNAKVLFPGTGSENSNISLVASQDGRFAAFVSTRDNQHDGDGFLLSSLTLINVGDGSSITLGRGAQIQLIDWIGSRLIYELVSSDSSNITSKYTIVGYDATASSRVQLAAATHLNAVFSAQGSILYAVAADSSNPSSEPAFYRINPDGANKQKVLDKEVWSGQRVDYNTIDLQTSSDGWFTYDLVNNHATSISSPASYVNRSYSDNAGGSKSLWVNSGDGSTGIVLTYNVQANKDSTVQSATGISYPIRWLGSDTVIYRIVTVGETADYAASLIGGAAHKIVDVTNTYGFSAGQ